MMNLKQTDKREACESKTLPLVRFMGFNFRKRVYLLLLYTSLMLGPMQSLKSALPSEEQQIKDLANISTALKTGSAIGEGKIKSESTISPIWQPNVYEISRYQSMLGKSPFGKVPVNAPPPPKGEEVPLVEEKQFAIAAVSFVEGKAVVYLIDLKTRDYQKINSEEENEGKIKLVEINAASNPRDVVAKVMINGNLSTVKYDESILGVKPKSITLRKGRRATNTASQRGGAPGGNAAGNQSRVPPIPDAVSRGRSPNARRSVIPAVPGAGKSSPGRLQDRRRLSAVPRRRVIVPGRSTNE